MSFDLEALMARTVARAEHGRLLAPPNPWVGSLIVTTDGTTFEGNTQRPGDLHAEKHAIASAGERTDLLRGATLFTTLEPCNHHGRTPPCTEAIIDAGIGRVVIALEDPDPQVAGTGSARLREAGIDVVIGPGAELAEAQLAPYLHHRRTGRPYVVLKLAGTLDGRTAAPDGTSQWITGEEARLDAHRLRAESDAILVGAGTVRADDPALTVRNVLASDGQPPRPPLRVVLGSEESVPAEAKIRPCREMSGDLDHVLEELGADGVVQLMIEGGAGVAGSFHRAGLVDRHVLYLAPALMGGDDGLPLFSGPGAVTIGDVFRSKIDRLVKLGNDVRIDLVRSDQVRREEA